MPRCCYHDEYGEVFPPAEAASQARRFRRRGLAGTDARLVSMLRAEGVADAHVLEVGGGVGDVLVALFDAGAAHAIDVDLSPSWVDAARRFVDEHGYGERFEARAGDFVDEAAMLPEVDVVILNRVVCCYPDMDAMLAAAAGRSRRVLALVYPADRWTNRAAIAIANLWFRLRRLQFRVFVHPEASMRSVLRAAGMEVVRQRSGVVWRTVVLTRSPALPSLRSHPEQS